MCEYNIHNIKFIDFVPKSINSIAYNEKEHKIAIARQDGSIEIRNIRNNMANDFIIHGKDGRSVEHLEWCGGNRLFSSGLTGEIIEWNLETLTPKYQQDSYGGPVWYIKFNHAQTKMAAGCEDGSIRIFNVEDDAIIYVRSLSVQGDRILSLSWDFNDEFIVSGGFGSLCVYNVKNGQIITKMSPVHRKNEKTVVWAVEYLKNGFIAIGDSLGNTQFWCANTYTLISSFKSHEADVLSIALSPDQLSVFSTGIDSRVAQFRYEEGENVSEWKMINHIKATDHDTRALVCCNEIEPFLVSGGVDPRFVIYPLNNFSIDSFSRYSCMPSNAQFFSLAHKESVVTFHNEHTVHGWKLGRSAGDKYQKLFEIESKDHSFICCSSISVDAKYIAYSTLSKNHICEIIKNDENQTYTIHKVEHFLPPATHLFFRNDKDLICISHEKKLFLCDLKTSDYSQINFNKTDQPSLPFTKLTASRNAPYAAICDASQKIFIFDLEKLIHTSTLPLLKGGITDMKFHPVSNNLFIVTSSRHFYEYDINEKKLLSWAKKLSKKKVFQVLGRPKHHILNIAINPVNDNEIFLQTKDAFGKLIHNFDVENIPDPEEGESKRKRAKLTNSVLRVNYDYRDTMFFNFTDNGDIVLVRHDLTKTLHNLPEPVKLQKFGD